LNFLSLIFIFSICVQSSEHSIDNILINSDSIEIKRSINQVIFTKNVNINTGTLIINADNAVYDNLKRTISVNGSPSIIDSTLKDIKFRGQAKEIIFFDDTKIHLIGSANMSYDNMNISSNMIIFNPQNGNMSSNE
jgi:lipopolysaccharide transport protein LptA